MPDTFAITIISIIAFTVIAAFIRGRAKDKCLRSFSQYMVTLEETSGKTVWGKLRVENTGLEFVYPDKHKDKKEYDEASYILYKHEYPNIQALVRYHDNLTETGKNQRNKELKRTYHPSIFKKLTRKILNIFKTVRDSFMDVINLLIGQARRTATTGAILSSQDKYVNQLKQELVGSIGTSYEPLLERYIGHKVILEMIRGDKILGYQGILKDYTADFIEILDVNYITNEAPPKKADLVVPRKSGTVRHLGE